MNAPWRRLRYDRIEEIQPRAVLFKVGREQIWIQRMALPASFKPRIDDKPGAVLVATWWTGFASIENLTEPTDDEE